MASTIKVDNVQNQPGTNIVSKCGTDVTLGASGDTVALAAGASQTGFGRTGTVDWITTPKVTGDSPVTGVTGKGYFLNTTAGTITLNLPAGAAGSIVSMADYAATWQTNNVTVAANGAEKIGGDTNNATLSTEGQSVTFVYVDGVQGWVNTMDSTSNVRGLNPYIVATGGTPCAGATCGDYKIHTFTGPGTFAVTNAATCAADNLVSYMVVAGGGSGGNAEGGTNGNAGGAGAGGFRELVSPTAPYTASPLNGYPNAPNRITVSATPYTITVGGGGPSSPTCNPGAQGSTSTFSTISSAGGGGGGGGPGAGGSGGSGGGASNAGAIGSGNTPPTTPSQGNNGGATFSPGNPSTVSGGGGGAGAVGGNGNPGGPAGPGGAGVTSEITASPVARAGGGGGGGNSGETGGGTGGPGGGGAGGTFGGPACGVDGGLNTGGGGGATAANCGSPASAGAGGSGVVVIRYKFQ